eukprot:3501951-Prymnesium_polylepis.2
MTRTTAVREMRSWRPAIHHSAASQRCSHLRAERPAAARSRSCSHLELAPCVCVGASDTTWTLACPVAVRSLWCAPRHSLPGWTRSLMGFDTRS